MEFDFISWEFGVSSIGIEFEIDDPFPLSKTNIMWDEKLPFLNEFKKKKKN